MGGQGGDDGGMGGDGGPAAVQGGTGGMMMGGAGGAIAGGGAGGRAGGGAGGATAGGGAGGAVAGGGAGGKAGGGAGGAAGGGGTGGVAATCDPLAPEISSACSKDAQETPPVTTTATGIVDRRAQCGRDRAPRRTIEWTGLTSNTSLGHIHGPAAVGMPIPPIVTLNYNPPTTAMAGSSSRRRSRSPRLKLGYLKAGQLYANIHSANNPTGEIRAQLLPPTVLRSGTMTAAQETTVVTSTATGRSFVAIFPGNTQAIVSVSWTGLTTNTSNGHVHGPAAPGATASPILSVLRTVPPTGATMSGSLVHTIWTLGAGHFETVRDNLSYTNIHSTSNPARRDSRAAPARLPVKIMKA